MNILLCSKQTKLEMIQERSFENRLKRLKEYGQDLKDSHIAHNQFLKKFLMILKKLGHKVTHCKRNYNSLPDLSKIDLAISLGGDGTFIHTSHWLKSIPLLGVNSTPKSSVGHFCCFNAFSNESDICELLTQIEKGVAQPKKIDRLEAKVNGETVYPWAINDFLIFEKNLGITSQYILNLNEECWLEKSSGLWISTAMGSTAAFSSAGGTPFLPKDSNGNRQYGLISRELYKSEVTDHRIHLIKESTPFSITSAMIDGSILIDGIANQVKFGIGDSLTFKFANTPLITF